MEEAIENEMRFLRWIDRLKIMYLDRKKLVPN